MFLRFCAAVVITSTVIRKLKLLFYKPLYGKAKCLLTSQGHQQCHVWHDVKHGCPVLYRKVQRQL
jgi:hypothetical protein